MASTKQTSYNTQVRKTISFSKRRDHELIQFIIENDDDFSYNAKQLMLDGLRYRQLTQNDAEVDYLKSPTVSLQQSFAPKEQIVEKRANNEVAKPVKRNEQQWEELMEVETEEAEIDHRELEKNLDEF